MATFLADLRFGLRMLVKTPVLSVIAVVTVALGVGLTAHTFSVVHGSVIRGIPLPDAGELVSVGRTNLEAGIDFMEFPYSDFLEVRAAQTSFEDLGGFYQGTVNVAGEEGPPERFAGAFVTWNALDLAGVGPLVGRTFRAGEDLPGASPVVVLGHHVWVNRYASDPGIVGTTIRVNGENATVVGVMPPGFRFPFLEDLWLPHRLDPDPGARDDQSWLDVFGRLRSGVSMDGARAELGSLVRRVAERDPEASPGLGAAVTPYEERFMPREIVAVVYMMLAAVFGVLLIACANVANLLLARATVRGKEVAIRTALGASRFRVVRQLMAESAVLAVVGSVVGLGLAAVGVDLFAGAIADIYKPYWIDVRIDAPVILFTIGITLVSALAAGAAPALRASGVRVGEVLKDESRGSSSLRLGRFSTVLVVGEIAVSCGLLVGAGLLVKSIVNLRNLELGFSTESILTGRVGLFEADYPDEASRFRFFEELEERLAAEPGVTSVAVTSSLPALGSGRWRFGVEGEAYATDRDYPISHGTVTSAGFFETFRVGVIQGRSFELHETRPGGDPVVLVNQSFARRFFPDGEVLGKRIRLGNSTSTRSWMTIVGIVPDLHVGGNVGGIGDDLVDPAQFYMPRGMIDLRFMSVAVQTAVDPLSLAPRLREIVAEIDPNLPVYDLLPMDRAVRKATWAFGLFGSLFTIFGIVALFLAAVGLYGVMAFSVSQRRQEMGVRMALGAEGGHLIRMVMGRGAGQLALGMGLGLALGALLAKPLQVILFGVDAFDPAVYLTIAAALGLAGMLASFVPALAATRADPVTAMRA